MGGAALSVDSAAAGDQRLRCLLEAHMLLLRIEILHDLIHPHARNCGGAECGAMQDLQDLHHQQQLFALQKRCCRQKRRFCGESGDLNFNSSYCQLSGLLVPCGRRRSSQALACHQSRNRAENPRVVTLLY